MTGKVSPFYDAELLREWGDGYKLVEVRTHRDLKILSANGGGCAEHHGFLTELANPQCDFMFVMVHDGQVGTILFCKRQDMRGEMHPQEAERTAWWKEHYGAGYMYSHLHSSYYDSFPDGMQNDIAYFERDVKRARERYERIKAHALLIGPLRKGHPLKSDVDEANKAITTCQGILDKEKIRVRVCSGQQFMYRGTELFVLQISGRGTDYSGTNTRYTDKLVDFMTGAAKEVAVGTT